MQADGGEVQHADDAGFDELVHDLLRRGDGDGEDSHADASFTDDAGHVHHGEDAGEGGAGLGLGRFGVEGGHDFEAFWPEALVGQECGAEVAHAHENDGLETVGP